MQKEIQPKYNPVEVRCACGNRQIQEKIQNGLIFIKVELEEANSYFITKKHSYSTLNCLFVL